VSRPPDDLPQACRRAQIIGAALVLALVVYAVVVEIFTRRSPPFRGFAPDAQVGMMRLLLMITTIGNLIVGRVLRRQFDQARARAVSPGATGVGQRRFTQSVVELALAEAIAVQGLVLFMVGGQPMDFYGFAAVSLLVLAVYFPRLSRWEERVREGPRR
jgi:F0F1-type ATP synthase membrane subunit c/vacuolar-type H+-ATPase subunit K